METMETRDAYIHEGTPYFVIKGLEFEEWANVHTCTNKNKEKDLQDYIENSDHLKEAL